MEFYPLIISSSVPRSPPTELREYLSESPRKSTNFRRAAKPNSVSRRYRAGVMAAVIERRFGQIETQTAKASEAAPAIGHRNPIDSARPPRANAPKAGAPTNVTP